MVLIDEFYWDWMSFQNTEDHWYELLWRLAVLIRDKGTDRLRNGGPREIWPHPYVPKVFLRRSNHSDVDSSWEELDVAPYFAKLDANSTKEER